VTDSASERDEADTAYMDQVRAYYDTATPLYLAHVGPSLQAGLLRGTGGPTPALATNLYMGKPVSGPAVTSSTPGAACAAPASIWRLKSMA
jgi:hypothetical protein